MAKQKLIGFKADDRLTAALIERVETLGVTMTVYLKGLVQRDLGGPAAPLLAEANPTTQQVPPSAPGHGTAHQSEKPTAKVVVPEKFLGLDLFTLVAWHLGLLKVFEQVHPADVSLVAKHYTSADDTTRPVVLRRAVRQVLCESWRQLPTWLKQLEEFIDRHTT